MRGMPMKMIIAGGIGFVAWAVALAAEPDEFPLRYDSGEKQVTLIELFTSQGCSSCPPAERWLSGLLDRPGLWADFVPIAWHVDYWDRLGWRDPFASAENTERQYAYRDAGRLDKVYTPAFVVRGKEWRGWFLRKELDLDSQIEGSAGRLQIRFGPDGRFEASYSSRRPLQLHLVALAFGQTTRPLRGENRGRELEGNFVAVGDKYSALGDGIWTGRLESLQGEGEGRARAVAAWVTLPGEWEPLQAVGGWWPEVTAGKN